MNSVGRNIIKNLVGEIDEDRIVEWAQKVPDLWDIASTFNNNIPSQAQIQQKGYDWIMDRVHEAGDSGKQIAESGYNWFKEQWIHNTPGAESIDYSLFQYPHSESAQEAFSSFLSSDNTSDSIMETITSGDMGNISFKGLPSSDLDITWGVDSDLFDSDMFNGTIEAIEAGSDLLEGVDTVADIADNLLSFDPTNLLLGFAATAGAGAFVKWLQGDKKEKIERLSKKIAAKTKLLLFMKNGINEESAYPTYKDYLNSK